MKAVEEGRDGIDSQVPSDGLELSGSESESVAVGEFVKASENALFEIVQLLLRTLR